MGTIETIGRWLAVWGVFAAMILAGSSISAVEIALPLPWHDVDLHHHESEPYGGITWVYNYYFDANDNGHFDVGENTFDEYAADVNGDYSSYGEDWGDGYRADNDYSAWMASGANMLAYRSGETDPQETYYENWAYNTGLNGQTWDYFGYAHTVLDHYGVANTVMKTNAPGQYKWYAPMIYARNCLREGSPVVLGLTGGRNLTVYGMDPDAGTLKATDSWADDNGSDWTTYQYSGEQITAPFSATIEYLCSYDVVAWWTGMGDRWSRAECWANRHVPTAAQAVYLNHDKHIDLEVDGTAEAKAIYMDTPNPGQRMYLSGGASLSVSQAVVLGESGNGLIEQFGGTMEVGTDLTLAKQSGGRGFYELHGGTLGTANTYVGDSDIGRFTQDGGIHTIDGLLSLGHSSGGDGTYLLGEAPGNTSQVTAHLVVVGNHGPGIFEQSGGTNTVSGSLTVGGNASGTYRLSGGTLDASLDMCVGASGMGTVEQSGGTAHVGRYLEIGDGTNSAYTLTNGSLAAYVELLGCAATGSFHHNGGDHLVGSSLQMGTESDGKGLYTFLMGGLEVKNLVVGELGEGELFQNGFVTLTTLTGESWIGHQPGSKGKYTLKNGFLNLENVLHVGYTDGLAPGETPPEALFSVDAGQIAATAANGRIVVHGSSAKLTGAGSYDVPVVFESDPIFGPASDKIVSVGFDKSSLQRANTFWVVQGLEASNLGGGDQYDRITAATSADALWHVTWRNPNLPDFGYVEYRLNDGTNDLKNPELKVPYGSGQVTGNGRLSAGDIEKRMNLWQFRDGVVRNVVQIDGDGVAAIDATDGVITGAARRVAGDPGQPVGDFDLALGATAVDPVHQNPQIAALHAAGLSGEGVVMGQLEVYVPYKFQGCFNDWDNADPSKRRLAIDSSADGSHHATQVASIMVGYDPLGLQVNGLGRLVDSAHCYESGFGFVGAAPKATLTSRTVYNAKDEMKAFVEEDGMEIVNMSAGLGW